MLSNAPSDQLRHLLPYGDILAGHPSIRTATRSSYDERTGKPLTWLHKEWAIGKKTSKSVAASVIECNLYLFDTDDDANLSFDKSTFGQNVSLERTSSGWTLGEKFRCIESGQALRFLCGRIMVKVGVQSYSNDGQLDTTAPARDAKLAEAVARGIEYTLSTNSAITQAITSAQIHLTAAPDIPPAVIIGKNAWAPLSSVRSLGVQVARDEKNGTVTLAYRGRTLILTPLSRKARLGSQDIDLGLPVLQQQQDVVLPIGAVAKALQLLVPVSVL